MLMRTCRYNNKDTSGELEEFLEWLAFRVTLKGWNRFRGGLNVKGTCAHTSTCTRTTHAHAHTLKCHTRPLAYHRVEY